MRNPARFSAKFERKVNNLHFRLGVGLEEESDRLRLCDECGVRVWGRAFRFHESGTIERLFCPNCGALIEEKEIE